MSKSKKEKEFEVRVSEKQYPNEIQYHELNELEKDYQREIDTNPRFSLEVDPENKYNLTEKEVDFIKLMTQYRNVQFVSVVLMNLSIEEGVEMYKSYPVQEEIKRINLAMYARRFSTKMADLSEIGGFLTSGLVDENVPVAERWSGKEKLTAAKMLINLNILRKESYNHPETVEVVEIQKDLDKLSPNELKQLIEYNDEGMEEKEALIDTINKDNLLSIEELKNLRLMSIDELKELADIVTKGLENVNPEEEDEDDEDEED